MSAALLDWMANGRPEWHALAECTGANPALFYPASNIVPKRALAYCKVCRVRPQCLEWALENGEHDGVWGGLSMRARRRIVRDRKRALRLAVRAEPAA